MARITRLDPLVSSQIAAGEVVERPASAVKELVENSIDAGANRITIDFEDGGLSLLRVSDDGSGMSMEDAPLSIERFATSKLATADDLSRIASLGFRGEALPSIASCSRLTLETKAEGSDAGAEVRVVGGVVLAVAEKGLPQGTTVTVRDLFFNTPARLRFVKSHASERQAIIDVVMRLALAWPGTAFTLRTGGKTVFATTGQGLRNAIQDVFGPEDASSMIEVESLAGEIRVSGFAGLPSLYRRQRDRQIFAVNGRPVRDTSLGWALDAAYAGLIPPKTYPTAILNIQLPPQEVDVNVHPTKSQVKFRDEPGVKRAVTRAVSEALQKGLGTSRAVNMAQGSSWVGGATPGRVSDGARSNSWSEGALPHRAGDRSRILPPSRDWSIIRDSDSPGIGPSRPEELGLWTRDAGSTSTVEWQYLGSVADTYLIGSTSSSVLIVDKHALMESLTFAALNAGSGGSQELLMAEIVRLDPNESLVYEESADALSAVGFASRMVGERTIMVTAVPMVLGRAVAPGAIREVLSRMSLEDARDAVRAVEAARLETAACHASVRAKEPLSADEARALLKELEQNPGARACPHGRPTVREITMKEMAGFFGRS